MSFSVDHADMFYHKLYMSVSLLHAHVLMFQTNKVVQNHKVRRISVFFLEISKMEQPKKQPCSSRIKGRAFLKSFISCSFFYLKILFCYLTTFSVFSTPKMRPLKKSKKSRGKNLYLLQSLNAVSIIISLFLVPCSSTLRGKCLILMFLRI